MASTSKQKTTMAKLNRERALRERRERKQAKKDARKRAAEAPPSPEGDLGLDAGAAADGAVDVESPVERLDASREPA
jgi:hypothetical protein